MTNSITFFVGEKGSGKSTLLETIAVVHGFNLESGTKHYALSTHSELCNAIRVSKGYRKENGQLSDNSILVLECLSKDMEYLYYKYELAGFWR